MDLEARVPAAPSAAAERSPPGLFAVWAFWVCRSPWQKALTPKSIRGCTRHRWSCASGRLGSRPPLPPPRGEIGEEGAGAWVAPPMLESRTGLELGQQEKWALTLPPAHAPAKTSVPPRLFDSSPTRPLPQQRPRVRAPELNLSRTSKFLQLRAIFSRAPWLQNLSWPLPPDPPPPPTFGTGKSPAQIHCTSFSEGGGRALFQRSRGAFGTLDRASESRPLTGTWAGSEPSCPVLVGGRGALKIALCLLARKAGGRAGGGSSITGGKAGTREAVAGAWMGCRAHWALSILGL